MATNTYVSNYYSYYNRHSLNSSYNKFTYDLKILQLLCIPIPVWVRFITGFGKILTTDLKFM